MAELIKTALYHDANLVAYYRGNDINDNSLTGNKTLTNNNTVAFNAGQYGNAFDLGANNTTKYLSRSENYGINGDGDISIVFWFKMQSVTGNVNVFVQHNSTGNITRYFQSYYNDGDHTIRVDAGGISGTYSIALDTVTWHHIAIIRTGTTNAKLYVDGTEQASVVPGTGNVGNLNYLQIGVDATLDYASAIIDDLGIFNRVLSVSEIGILSGNGPTTSTSSSTTTSTTTSTSTTSTSTTTTTSTSSSTSTSTSTTITVPMPLKIENVKQYTR